MKQVTPGLFHLESIEAEVVLRWVNGVYDDAITEIPNALSELKNDTFWQVIVSMRKRLQGGGLYLAKPQWDAFYGANIGNEAMMKDFQLPTSVDA